MKMISELFIKQKTWFNFVSFLTEQSLLTRPKIPQDAQAKVKNNSC